MSFLTFFDHVLNLIAPAVAMGLALAVMAPLLLRRKWTESGLFMQIFINSIAAIAALLIGLAVFGHDGKMTSYAFMLFCCTTSQWVGMRAWR